MSKKGQLFSGGMIVLALLGVIFLVQSYIGTPDTLSIAGEGGDVVPGFCASTTTPSWTLNAVDKHSGDSLTGTYKYRIGDGVVSAGTLGTAITTFSVGDEINVIMSSGSYYNLSKVYTVPCKEGESITEELLAYDTAVNISSIVNDDGITKNTDANTEDVTAGEKPLFSLVFKSNSEVGGDYVVICEVNNTEISDLNSDLAVADVPDFFSVSQTDYRAYAFNVGLLEDSTGRKDFWIEAVADSSVNPTNDIQCDIQDKDWFIDEKGDLGSKRAFIYGLEDENNKELGQTKAEFDIRLS